MALLAGVAISLLVAAVARAETYEHAVEGTAGIAHLWPMGEASGSSSFADVVGGDEASLSGGVTLGEPGGLVGESATAAAFNGSSGAAQASVDLSGTHELTVEFWMKWSSYSSDDQLAMEFTPNFNENPGGFLVDPNASPGSDFAVSIGEDDSRNTVYFERPSAGGWHYYAFVIDTEAPAESEITPYVDGRAVSYTKSESGTGAGSFADSTLFWMSRDASTLFGEGSMQDVALYDTTLSAGTIAEHYELGEGGPKATFSSTPTTATAGVPVHFDASGSSSPGGSIVDYAWDFDGSKSYSTDTGETSTVSHTFTSPGTYTVDLRVKDSLGETATVSQTFTVGAALGPYEQAVEENPAIQHFWPMSEASGASSLTDVIAGDDAEVLGGVTLGEPGGLADSSTAAAFDGSTGAARAAVDLSGTHQLTVEFWMKWSAYAEDDRLAMEFTPNFNENPGGFLVDPDASGTERFGLGIGHGESRNNAYFARPSAGEWHYYAFTFDTSAGGADEITPYVDGRAVSYTKSEEGTGAGTFADSVLYWMSRDASSLFGEGSMQDVALYDTTLSAGTIAEHYELGEGGPKATFASTPDVASVGVPVQLNAAESTSPAGTITDYAWDFDGSKSYATDAGETSTVSHTFTSPGTYTVDLRIKDSLGETATVSHTITVAPELGQYEQAVEETPHVTNFWPMSETSGSILADAIGGANATLSGGVSLDEPGGLANDPATAAAFNGSSGAAQAPLDLSGTHELTIEFWMKWTSYASNDQLALEFTPNFNETPGGFLVDPNASPGSDFAVSLGQDSSRNTVYFERPSAGEWHYYTFVIDTDAPAAEEITPYVDGKPVPYTKTEEGTGAGAFADSTLFWMSRDASSLFGQGSMQDLALYDTTLDASTIEEHYELGEGTLPPVEVVAPSIEGTAEEGHQLRADPGVWDGSQPLSYTYQWESCNAEGEECAEIEGADQETYELTAGDVGNTVRLDVAVANGGGLESTTSPASGVVTTPVSAPLSLSPPAVSGQPEEGQRLAATTGTWTGASPLAYSYRWERCNDTGENCVDVPDATASSYQLGAADVGSSLRVLVETSNTEGRASRLSAPSRAVQSASPFGLACTDTWIGPAEGGWSESANWSASAPPGPTDVACLGPETEITIDEQTEARAAVLRDAGKLVLQGQSLELTDSFEASTIEQLVIGRNTENRIGGAGSIYISGSLLWEGSSTMWGSGRTVLEAGATGNMETVDGCETMTLADGRKLVNEGELTFTWGSLVMSRQTSFENAGIFYDNAEEPCDGSRPEISYVEEEEAEGLNATILNTGLFEKYGWDDIHDISGVEVPFTNDGVVAALQGELWFVERNPLDQASTGLWEPGETRTASINIATYSSVRTGTNLEAVSVFNLFGGEDVVYEVPAPASLSPPSIVGTMQAGQTLTATSGGWSGAEPIIDSYQWQRCNASGGDCGSIPGAEGPTYTLQSSDIGAEVRVMVTASNTYGEAQAPSYVSAAIATPPAPSNTAAPTIAGISVAGDTLAASSGEWSGSAPVSYSYQWESCNPSGAECAPVEEATEATYELAQGDIESTLRVAVTASDAGGSATVRSEPTAGVEAAPPSELQAPSVTGVPDARHALRAEPGAWSGSETELGYQWESCDEDGGECAAIPGATEPEYDLAEGDVGSTLRVRVGDQGALDSISDVSPVTPVIGAQAALASVAQPAVSGTPQTGQALSASPGSWAGGVGSLSYSYQWQSCDQLGASCEAIGGATAQRYTASSGQVGHRLRVLVTAKDGEGHTAARASQGTQPVGGSEAPVVQQAPAIAGPTLVGQTMTVGTGGFALQAPASYAYQWKRCPTGGACEDIEGATHSSYTLTEADIGSTLVALVSATDGDGSTTAASPATAVVRADPLTELAPPSIAGRDEQEGTLRADPGIWTATGTVSYAYQWRSCNSSGEDCSAIEGATEPTYTVTHEELTATLRVAVTATSPLGSKTAVSAYVSASTGGEVSATEAQEILERTDPAVLSPSTSTSLEGETVAPALGESEEELAAHDTLASSTISLENAGEFAVSSPAGELSIAPTETASGAASSPTVVNGTSALFPNTWAATDTIVRPEPLGATTLLQIRSAQAPRSFSWEVHLGPEEELQQLADGSVAVVQAAEETTEGEEEAQEGEASQSAQSEEIAEGPGETSEEETEAENAEAEATAAEEAGGEEGGEEAPLESLPTPARTEAAAGEAKAGQPEPQETATAYEAATTAMSAAETQSGGRALLVVSPPSVTDAEGHTVPATLSANGNKITLTVDPSDDASYPLLAATAVAAHSDKDSSAHRLVRYGISDQRPQAPGHIDEHFKEDGQATAKFDPNLFDGPPNTTRHMRTSRLVLPYDTFVRSPGDTENRHILEDWLRKAKKQGFEPYLTLGQNFKIDPCKDRKKATEAEKACPKPSIGQYEKAVKKLMEEVIKWHLQRHWPLVKLWGAWNEPDFVEDPFHKDAPRAAQFWELANSMLHSLEHRLPCSGCTVIAGEFSTYYPDYSSCYRNVVLYGYCTKTGHTNHYKRYWFGRPRDPLAWGFHDYQDLLNDNKEDAKRFAHFTKTRLSKPRLFMSEAGVELQTGKESETSLGELGTKTETERAAKRTLQLKAAEDFVDLPAGLSYPINRMNYYEYTAPTKAEQTNNAFDSGLLEVENKYRRERPAYCVLAYTNHRCPPVIADETSGTGALATGTVNPNDLETKYRFDYGPTSSYGYTTPFETLRPGMAAVEVSANISETGGTLSVGAIKPMVTCGSHTTYYRIEAVNASGTRRGSGSVRTYGSC